MCGAIWYKQLYVLLYNCNIFFIFSGNNCPELADIENGGYLDAEYPGWPKAICAVKYYCDPGYKMIGNKYLVCISDQWFGTPPTCQSE